MADEWEKAVLEAAGSNSWEGAAINLGKTLLTHLLQGQANQGPSQAQEDAMRRMMQIATGQYNMQAKQANMDLPLRQDLFSSLRNREAERAPRIQPGSFRPSNPYQRLNRVGPSEADLKKLMPSLVGGGKGVLGAGSKGWTPGAGLGIGNPLNLPTDETS
tara:strand:+ start:1391 stop:1870 length:480 start_codon:yes stop_codon:yes gene_type:complete